MELIKVIPEEDKSFNTLLSLDDEEQEVLGILKTNHKKYLKDAIPTGYLALRLFGESDPERRFFQSYTVEDLNGKGFILKLNNISLMNFKDGVFSIKPEFWVRYSDKENVIKCSSDIDVSGNLEHRFEHLGVLRDFLKIKYKFATGIENPIIQGDYDIKVAATTHVAKVLENILFFTETLGLEGLEQASSIRQTLDSYKKHRSNEKVIIDALKSQYDGILSNILKSQIKNN